MSKVITLTTDFGMTDEFVGVMKGVILSRAPEVQIVDLNHAISPFNITLAAYVIDYSYKYFPKGSVHVIVVDPGVGGSRDIILLEVDNYLFLAPDNGILTLLLEKTPVRAFKVTNKDLFLGDVSTTFHGRDIFAPVAAHLVKDGKISDLGKEIPISSLTTLPLPKPAVNTDKNQITGSIIGIDHFGNACTNIDKKTIEQAAASFKLSCTLEVNNLIIESISNSYKEIDPLQPLMLFNSKNYLEIAVNLGSAAKMFDLSIGTQVTIRA